MLKFAAIGLALATVGCKDGAPPPEYVANITQAELAASAETVIIGTKDGKKIYADHVTAPHTRATIVLFHQAGSSVYEYRDIALRLNAAGYSTLAVDLRSGGSLYGPNRTVNKYGKSAADYLDALPDMEAALNWSRLQGQPVILLGSSYSASLAIRLAADNPTLVAAVLAFSPGEYFADKSYASDAAARLTVPLFVTQGREVKEISESKPIFSAAPGNANILFEPRDGGVHGASTLRTDRNPAGAKENWQAVTHFLESLALPPS